MYEYYDNNNKDQSRLDNPIISNEQLEAIQREEKKKAKKAAKKAARVSFFKKVGIGAATGLAFGVIAGFAFEGVTRIADIIFPTTEHAVLIEEDEEEATTRPPVKESKEVESVAPITRDSEDTDSGKVREAIAQGMDVRAIVNGSMPSIVSITNKSVQEVRSMFGMGIQQYESESAGSGIIIGQDEEELLVATNNHVIAGAQTLTVGFIDDEVYTAYVKGADPDIDLAVVAVKIEDLKSSTVDAIKVAVIGKSGDLEVGEQVVAIGNALGYGQSVTTGIISAMDRDVTDDGVENPLIQTDAAINPGNSGGALLNMNGELIGINCAKIASTSIEGVGYAIPMDSAVPIIETLMNRQTREEVDAKDAGYIGISGVSVDKSTSEMYGIPVGIYIQTVEENSPAEEAGLIKSDVVRKFDGITVSSISDIRDNLNYYRAGEQVDLEVYRLVDGEYVEKTITITLGSREGTALDPDNQPSEDNNQETEQVPDDGQTEYFFNGGGNSIEDFFRMFP